MDDRRQRYSPAMHHQILDCFIGLRPPRNDDKKRCSLSHEDGKWCVPCSDDRKQCFPRNEHHWMILILFMLIGIILLMLNGCVNRPYSRAKHRISDTQFAIHQHEVQTDEPLPPVLVRHQDYVDPHPIPLAQQPRWLRQAVHIQVRQMPFHLVVNRLLEHAPVSVSYDQSVDPNQLIDWHFKGSVVNALKNLTAMTQYAYDLHHHNLNWSGFVTHTFNISFMPGAAHYLVGRSESASTNSGHVAGGGASGVVNGGMSDEQYSNMAGQLSVWADLQHALDQLKSPEGRVIISESSTSVTVHDRPHNVAAMARYIHQLNVKLSEEVGINVQVLEVQLNQSYNLGIDWNAIAHVLGTQLSLSAGLSAATDLTTNNVMGSGVGASGLSTFQIGGALHNVLINALDQQGRVRVVTRPRVVTLNNQIASIRITKDTGYVQSVSSSAFGGGADNHVTTTIEPGTVTDGFTLYLLPKIQGDRVYLQISSTISNLLKLEKVSTAPSDHGGKADSFNAIEVPTLAKKTFNLRSAVRSGSTLIIAGFKQLRDETSRATLYGISPLGGHGALTHNVETLVLITPVIFKSNAD